MRTIYKKVTSQIVVFLMVVSLMLTNANLVQAITVSEVNTVFNNLKSSYPTGAIWKGNYKNLAWECHGFALLVCDSLFGENANNWGMVYNVNDLYIGDLVRYRSTVAYDHSIVVTNISEDTISYVDCNGTSSNGTYVYNRIDWTKTITRSNLRVLLNKTLTDGRSGFIRHKSGNNITSVSDSTAPSNIIYPGLAGFTNGGAYWRDASGYGINGTMKYTYCNGNTRDSWGKWSFNLESVGGNGKYKVEAYIPNNYATTGNAHYHILHSGKTDYKSVNQNNLSNAWVDLGTYDFTAAGIAAVELDDATGETYVNSGSPKIGFDAVRLTYVSPTDSQAVTGVSLNKSNSAINVGANDTLTATIAPTNATNNNVTWNSSNTAVATVDVNGNVVGVSAGTSVITVATVDGGKTATCTVTVSTPGALTNIIYPGLAGFTNGGEYWWDASGYGINGTMKYTYCNGNTRDSWGKWSFNLESVGGDGKYKVEAYIPNNYATTSNAYYHILHSGETDYKSVNQNNLSNAWVDLGTYDFTVADIAAVELDDATGETYVNSGSPKIGFDAVRLTYVSTIDTQLPSGSWITPTDGQTLVTPGSINLSVNATDNKSIAKVIFHANYDGQWHELGTDTHGGNGVYSLIWNHNVTPQNVLLHAYLYDASNNLTNIEGPTVAFSNPTQTVTGVSLNKNVTMINVGVNEILTVTIIPANATNKAVTWDSSNPDVATVDSNGNVKGIKAGKTDITVTTVDGYKTAHCIVEVRANTLPTHQNISLDKEWRISFSQPVGLNQSVLESNILLWRIDPVTKEKVKVDITPVIDAANSKVVIVSHSTPFIAGASYELLVNVGIKDLSGKSLSKASSLLFVTQAP